MIALPLGPTVRVSSPTEWRNPRTLDVDQLSTIQLLRMINAEDATVAAAVAAVLPQLAVVVDRAVRALRVGGRVHYFGAGTSGRLAQLDAAELGPTYSLPDGMFVAHHAGGASALTQAAEGVEDDRDAGEREADGSVNRVDVVIGLSASGRTPYALGALSSAHRIGAITVLLTANPTAAAADRPSGIDLVIPVDTGPEVVAGSTRMKAGSAQKQLLTAFSTAVMVRSGRTYSNLMVELVATNAKLRGRTITVLAEATGLSDEECAAALADAGGELKTALVAVLAGVRAGQARRALARAGGHVRTALEVCVGR